MKKISILLIITALLFAAGCQKSKVDSVLLITVDGLSINEASAFSSIHSRAAVFENAITPTPVALPAVVSLMTGLHPAGHQVAGGEYWALIEEAQTLAEEFRKHGKRTAAFIGASDLGYETGLNQGFDKYGYDFVSVPAGPFGYPIPNPADKITKDAIKWFKFFGDKPYFVWMHYGDMLDDWANPLSDADRKKALEKISASINELLAALPNKGENTLIVLTSPASNAVGAHGEVGHGTLLYNSTIRIPLDIAGPGVSPKQYNAPVSIEDVYPTIISLMNFELPVEAEVQGVDLAPMLRGGVGPAEDISRMILTNEPFYRWGFSPIKGIIKGNYKLIAGPGSKYNLFDVSADPDEKQDLAASKADIVSKMSVDLNTIEGLLGRVKSVSKSLISMQKPGDGLASPLDGIDSLAAFSKAAEFNRNKDYTQSLQKLIEAKNEAPTNKCVAAAAAIVASAEGNQPKEVVIALWETAVALNPNDSVVMTSLAQYRYDTGDRAGALVDINKILGTDQINPSADMLAATIYTENAAALEGDAKKQSLEKALKHLVSIIRSDNSNAEAFFKIGEVAIRISDLLQAVNPMEDPEKSKLRLAEITTYWKIAETYLERAVILDSSYVQAYQLMGQVALKQNDVNKARTNFQKYIEAAPNGAAAEEIKKIMETLPPKAVAPVPAPEPKKNEK